MANHHLEARLLAVLQELATLRKTVASLEYETVQLVRASGASWEVIGDSLDISRQAAARKFSGPKGRRV